MSDTNSPREADPTTGLTNEIQPSTSTGTPASTPDFREVVKNNLKIQIAFKEDVLVDEKYQQILADISFSFVTLANAHPSKKGYIEWFAKSNKTCCVYVNSKLTLVSFSGSTFPLHSELEGIMKKKGLILVPSLPKENRTFYRDFIIGGDVVTPDGSTVKESEELKDALFQKLLREAQSKVENGDGSVFFDYDAELMNALDKHKAFDNLTLLGRCLNENLEYRKDNELGGFVGEFEESVVKDVKKQVREVVGKIDSSLLLHNLSHCAEDNLIDYLFENIATVNNENGQDIFSFAVNSLKIFEDGEEISMVKIRAPCFSCKVTMPTTLELIMSAVFNPDHFVKSMGQLPESQITTEIPQILLCASKFWDAKNYSPPFYKFCKNLENLQSYLKSVDGNGWTPLLHAVRRKEKAIVQFFCKLGADVNYQIQTDSTHYPELAAYRRGRTALHHASNYSTLEVVKYLVEQRKANIDAKDCLGYSALHFACVGGNLDIIEYLIEKGKEKGKELSLMDKAKRSENQSPCITPLNYATQVSNPSCEVVVERLLNKLNENEVMQCFEPYAEADGWGEYCFAPSSFMDAVMRGHNKVVGLMLTKLRDKKKKKIFVNKSHGRKGVKPLLLAVEFGNFETVKTLIERGSCVNCTFYCGKGALQTAAEFGRADIAELLLKAGAEVDSRNPVGWTPLHVAVARGCPKVTEILLKNGADIEAVMDDGRSVLDFVQDGFQI